MELVLSITLLIIGGFLNRFIKPGTGQVYNLARAYLLLMILLCASYWLYSFAGITAAIELKMVLLLLRWGGLAGNLMLGYLMINILLKLMAADDPDTCKFLPKITRSTLWGVSILTANTFIIATVGKPQSFNHTACFFNASGYAIWFLYFVMIAEALGGLGVLLHFKLKTGPVAATVLMLIMIGALYTHRQNNSPYSDSYAAAGQFITLFLLQAIYYFEERAGSINSYNEKAQGLHLRN